MPYFSICPMFGGYQLLSQVDIRSLYQLEASLSELSSLRIALEKDNSRRDGIWVL